MTTSDGSDSHPVDVYVGQRIRAHRRHLRISQEALAEQIGVTFQQIQKYEKGSNRVSASKLFEISRILDVPIGFFFDGLPGAGQAVTSQDAIQAASLQASGEGVDILAAFARLPRPLRQQILKLCHALSAELAATAPAERRLEELVDPINRALES